MKNKKIVASIAIAAALAVSPVLCACSGDHYSDIDFPAQDTSYAVTSQGGSAVQYGNYVYFINGTRGYEDTDGKNNVWGDVVKGALYRAELNGSKVKEEGDAFSRFNIALDTESGLEFKFTEGKDYFDEPENVVNTTAIAPKTVGTSGYENGGIFIYDNYVYFASPNNEKNKTGTVQTTHTDFYMMSLSGGKPVKLYTSGTDTSSSAYAFYKFKENVYLVVNEDGKIVSVKVNVGKEKAEDPVTFKVNATQVYFPVRDTYYKGIDNNTVEDFIYFVRNVNDDDNMHSGTVIEAMRPDGSENFVVSENGQTEELVAVRDGVLFYSTTVSGKSVLAYDSLHDALMQYSSSYKNAQNKLDADKQYKQFSGKFPTELSSDPSIYPFRPDLQSNVVYYADMGSSSLDLYETDGTVTTIYSGSTGSALFIRENYLYYSGSSSDFYRVPLFDNMEGYGETQLLASETTSAGISCDYVAGYFTYFGEVDQWADSYTYFYKVDGRQNLDPDYKGTFVGKRAKADIPSDEELEDIKNGETEE